MPTRIPPTLKLMRPSRTISVAVARTCASAARSNASQQEVDPMSSLLTRREFLKVSFTAGGSLLLAACLDACSPPSPTAAPAPTATAAMPTTTPVPELPFQPNLYIRVDPDGIVTLSIHRSEMGQGVHTALAMILAEELEADWSKVRV